MNRLLVIPFVALLATAGLAIAQQQVVANQGKPGNQGPWPVISIGTDGGAVIVQPVQCRGTSSQKITTTGVAAVNTPSAQLAGRIYIEICNSLQNTGTPYIKCRVDGTAPVMAAGNVGDVLGVGDCIRYDIPAGVVPQCIADAATTYATSFECP